MKRVVIFKPPCLIHDKSCPPVAAERGRLLRGRGREGTERELRKGAGKERWGWEWAQRRVESEGRTASWRELEMGGA